MMKLSLVLCVLAVWAVAEVNCAPPHNALAPSVDCTTLIFNMADCLTFITNGSKVSKPEGNCCNGLKTVLKTDADCLCEASKSSAQLGVAVNISKALTLPSACGVSVPAISKCGFLSGAPGGAPGAAPGGAPGAAPGAAPAGAPAYSPKSSAPSPKLPAPAVPTPVIPAAAPVTSKAGESAPALPSPPSPPPSQSGASGAMISFVALLVSLVVASCSYY